MSVKEYSCVKKTKKAFANSLVQLSKNRQLNKITVKEICENAELSRNAFYFHYEDINALIRDIEDSVIADIECILKDIDKISFPMSVYATIDGLIDLFEEKKDTVLMLMNGSGIIGKVDNMEKFFTTMKQILKPGGVVYMDSSDLKYLFEDEDGSFAIDLAGDYYGQVDFRMQYKQIKGDTFDWLYIDFQTLSLYASQYGFKAELVQEGEHYDYLAALRML